MSRRQAIDLAIDAISKPKASSLLSVGPLPDGVKDLLRIVAEGEWRDGATARAYEAHSAEEVRAASAAFLGAVLFDRASDPYRVLGLGAGATPDDVRENKRLLLKWLHPDRNPGSREKEYLSRVLEAAEAIESGRALLQPPSRPRPAPVHAVTSMRAKPTTAAQARVAKRALVRRLHVAAQAAKLGAYVAGILLVALIAWRYVMDEPIGATIVRYSHDTLGFNTW